ncbi:unnamed protein product [Schistosoma curassoni]|uniref:BESS domain-containing protein n=1 Tax=Schistosoma curassoni TaxID=6186 RepID=A0A183KTT9_9TREM|nr:unnamed protein product [Schistosoma curassoni]
MALRNLCRGELESKFKKSPLHHMERDHFSSNYLSTHALRNPDNGKSAYQHDNTIRRKTQEYSSSIASPETGNSVVLCDSRQLNGELFNDISSTEEDHTVENIKNEGDVNLGFPNNRSHVLPSFNSLVTRILPSMSHLQIDLVMRIRLGVQNLRQDHDNNLYACFLALK